MITKALVNHVTKNFELETYSNGAKEIVFVPMIHIGRPDFFKKVRKSIDSLRKSNYIIYYESIAPSKGLDSIHRDIFFRKFRKIVGFFPDYISENNKQFKRFQIEGFIQQGNEIGIDSINDIKADIPLDKLVLKYESEKGKVILTECDLKTLFKEKYTCSKTDEDSKNLLLYKFRDEHLFNVVQSSPYPKIVIVYGRDHIYPLIKRLKEQDSLWKYIPQWKKIRN